MIDAMQPTPRRPWWKKKRYAAAAIIFWLLVAYLLSAGVAHYFAGRGWIERTTAQAFLQPLEAAYDLGDILGDLYDDFLDWCEDTGERHAGP